MSDEECTLGSDEPSEVIVLPEIHDWLRQHPQAAFAEHTPEIDNSEIGLLRVILPRKPIPTRVTGT